MWSIRASVSIRALTLRVVLLSLLYPDNIRAYPKNATIDDTYDGAVTPEVLSYGANPNNGANPNGGQWSAQPGCQTCTLHPDPSQALDGTWHDNTYISGDPPMSISFSFNGNSLYIYNIIPNGPTTALHATELEFTLDGSFDRTFSWTPTNTSDFLYNQLVYSRFVPNGTHTVVMTVPTDAPSGTTILFDYAIMTYEELSGDPPASSTSAGAGTPAATPTGAGAGANGGTSVGTSGPTGTGGGIGTATNGGAAAPTGGETGTGAGGGTNTGAGSGVSGSRTRTRTGTGTTAGTSTATSGGTSVETGASSDSSSVLSSKSSKHSAGLYAGIVIGVIIILALLTCLVWLRRRRRSLQEVKGDKIESTAYTAVEPYVPATLDPHPANTHQESYVPTKSASDSYSPFPRGYDSVSPVPMLQQWQAPSEPHRSASGPSRGGSEEDGPGTGRSTVVAEMQARINELEVRMQEIHHGQSLGAPPSYVDESDNGEP